jgi:ElaA protein
MEVTWQCRRFDELTSAELYEILALRERVFIVEQKCPYPDCDGKDFDALHVMGSPAGDGPGGSRIVAYSRILKPGVRFPEVSIGRVVIAPEHRGQSLGRKLMHQSLKRVSDEYMEDWIPHIEMLHHFEG